MYTWYPIHKYPMSGSGRFIHMGNQVRTQTRGRQRGDLPEFTHFVLKTIFKNLMMREINLISLIDSRVWMHGELTALCLCQVELPLNDL